MIVLKTAKTTWEYQMKTYGIWLQNKTADSETRYCDAECYYTWSGEPIPTEGPDEPSQNRPSPARDTPHTDVCSSET
jgi:hypothetical protein